VAITIDLPDEINYDQVATALKALGIPEATRVLSVHMDARFVEVRGMAGDTEFSHRYFVMPALTSPAAAVTTPATREERP
jgi:hypothetical protein